MHADLLPLREGGYDLRNLQVGAWLVGGAWSVVGAWSVGVVWLVGGAWSVSVVSVWSVGLDEICQQNFEQNRQPKEMRNFASKMVWGAICAKTIKRNTFINVERHLNKCEATFINVELHL